MGEKHRRSVGQWRCATVGLILICCVLIIAVMSVSIIKNRHLRERSAPLCDGDEHDAIDLREPEVPGVFSDLTSSEVKGLREYLHSVKELNLVHPNESAIDKSFVYTADIHFADKATVLFHTEMGGDQPAREARVFIFRGDENPPRVEEYIVGPLPKPSYHFLLRIVKRRHTIPDAFKPYSVSELEAVFSKQFPYLDSHLAEILLESYGATFTNCGDKCLTLKPIPMSTEMEKSSQRRLFLQAVYDVELYSLYPVDLMVLLEANSSHAGDFRVVSVYYGNEEFNLRELQMKYIAGSIKKSSISFPDVGRDPASALSQRDDNIPRQRKRRPRLVEPDGRRYSIKHKQVKYMQWQFDFRLSPLTGPSLHDIHMGRERLMYEISLQEIAVSYFAANVGAKTSNFVHGSVLLGTHAKPLMPGADCPETATYVNNTLVVEKYEEAFVAERSMCIFEQNTGTPLRRHMAYSAREGGYYGGMMDSALIVRTILAISNNDYVIDYVFHQNGVLETKVTPAGYLHGSVYYHSRFGHRLGENLVGAIHHRMFHFKVDLDIFGTSNRYQTLDIHNKKSGSKKNRFTQINYRYDLKQTEMEAAYKYNFEKPKYHLFYNNQMRDKHSNIRAIRLFVQGMSKQRIVDDEDNLPWAKYQIAVTKYDPHEIYSSSPYAQFDSHDPVVNFTQFISDNASIIDEDLVTWVTMGTYDIPHTEDIPLTSTVGKELRFLLIPFNYLPMDSSMASRDSIQVRYNNSNNPADGVVIETDDRLPQHRCITTPFNLTALADRPDGLLQSKNKWTLL